MDVHDGIEEAFRASAIEQNYNEALAENERLLSKQQTLEHELLEMKNAFDQLKKEQTSAKNSQKPDANKKYDKSDVLYATLREDSAKNRAHAFELESDLEKSKANLIEISSKLSKAESTIEIRESQIQSLENEVQLIRSDKDHLQNQLNRNQWEAKTTLNDSLMEKNKLMLQVNSLTFQKDRSDNNNSELSSKLASIQRKYEDSTYTQKELEADCDKYKTELMVAKRKYKELSNIYDEQNDHVSRQAQLHKLSIRKLEEKIYQLSSENKKLNAEKLAYDSSNVHNKDEKEEKSDLAEETRFKNLFRRPDCIIDHYSILLDESQDNSYTIKGLKASNAQLQKNLHNLQNDFNCKSIQYESLMKKHGKLKSDYKERTKQLKECEKENDELQSKLHRQERTNDELSKSLKDRNYQLQYVLKNTPNKALGPTANTMLANQLLGVYLEPASDPNLVKFRNMEELQTLNAVLLEENRRLTQRFTETCDATGQKYTKNELVTNDTVSKGIGSLESDQEIWSFSVAHSAQVEPTAGISESSKRNSLSGTSLQLVSDEYKVKIDTLAKDIQRLQSELASSKEDVTTAQHETSKKESLILHLQRTCDELEQKAASLEKRLNLTTAERSRLKGMLDASQEREKDAKKQISVLESRYASKTEELFSLDQRLNEKHASHQATLEKLRLAQNDEIELYASLKRSAAAMKQKEEMNDKTVQGLREELRKTKTELSSVKMDLQIFSSKADSIKSSSNESARIKYNDTLVKLRVVTEKLNDQDNIIKELVKEKNALMDKLEEAQETIKSNHLSRGQSSLASSSGTTTSVQSRLLADSQKRVVELEEKLTSYQQEIDQLKKDAQEAAKLNQENLQKNRDYIAKSIENIDNQNEILKSTQTKSQQSIHSFELAIKTSNVEIEKLKKENGSLSSELLTLKIENATISSKLNNSKEEMDMQVEKVMTLEENAKIQEELLDDRQKAIQELQTELQGLQKELVDAKSYETSAKEYTEVYKETLQNSIERWNSVMNGLSTQYQAYGIESDKWSQKLQQLIQENFDQITQEVPPTSAEDTTAMIESLQSLNRALTDEKKDMEVMLTSKLKLLETAQKEIIAEKSELSTLVDKVAFLRDSNQALLSKARPNDELYQIELRAYGVQNENLRREKEKLSAELTDVTNQLNIKIPEIQSLEGQVSKLTCELETANVEVQKLIETEKNWAARSANLLEVTGHMDPKELEELKSEYENAKAALSSSKSELESMKTDLESSKTELDTARKDLESVQANMKELETSKGELESERRELIKKANERTRFAVEFRKRCSEAEKNLEEKDKLITEKEKLLVEEQAKVKELEKKLEEESKTKKDVQEKSADSTPATQTTENKEKATSNDLSKSSEEARAEAVSKLETSEKQLARVQEELNMLKKRYQVALTRIHSIQNEKTKCEEELKGLKTNNLSGAKTSTEDAEKIKGLEDQITDLRKQLSDSQVENGRLKAMASMATNRSKKLTDEIIMIKGQLEKVYTERTKNTAAARSQATATVPSATENSTPATDAPITSTPAVGEKRTKEDGELDEEDAPAKKR